MQMLDERDINQTEFCKVLGIAQDSMYLWRYGKNSPGLFNVENAGEMLGYHLEWVKNDT